jgi:Zn-dependent protease with chaperone function
VKRTGHRTVLGLLGAAVVALLLSGCNEDSVERTLGNQASSSIEHSYNVCHDPALAEWINYAGHTVVGFTTRQHIPYTFTVLDSDTVNAFAAPWGHVYVYTGLLNFADSEDEVWGVMGHEVGHVVHRDLIKSVKRSILWNLGVGLVSSKASGAGDMLGLGLGILSFSYSREDERNADDHGAAVMYASGHDPNGMVSFFTKLMNKYEKDKPSKLDAIFATHPLTSNRIARLQARPEFSTTDATTLARIGDGYARRGRYLTAMKFLQQAISKDPDLLAAHLSLADAALARGYQALAASELRTVSDKLGYVPAIKSRLAYAESVKPSAWSAGVDERGRTKALLAQAPQVGQDAAAVAAAAAEAVSANTRELMKKLSTLGSSEKSLTDPLQKSLLVGNAAIGRFSELVSALEGASDQAAAMAATVADAKADLARVAALSPDALPPAASGWIARSYHELLQAPADARDSVALADSIRPHALAAAGSAADATTYMSRLMDHGEDALLMDSLAAASQELSEHVAATADATRKSRELAARAQSRIYLAQLNLAAAGATPEEMASMAQIIAYFGRTDAAEVNALVAQGLGLGEAAACLFRSPSAHRSPTDLGHAGVAKGSFIDAFASGGCSFAGTQILLKYAAKAISLELPTGGHEAPRLTS